MGFTSSDLEIDASDGWVGVTVTGTEVKLIHAGGADILCRVGDTSTSSGFRLSVGDSLASADNLYVKVSQSRASNAAKLHVIKD